MNADVHTLTGAYALDALHGAERQDFERHLAECPSCRQEVAELRQTAARLGAAAAAEPPPLLKRRVLAQVADVRQLPPESGRAPVAASAGARRPWPVRLAGLAAAACLVVAAVLGVQLVQSNREADRAQAQLAEVSRVLTAQDAKVVTATAAGGGHGTAVLSRARDQVVFVADGLPDLPAASTYQLWLIGPGGPRSAGLLSPTSPPLVAGGLRDASNLGVTVEPSGGSPAPTTSPVLLLALSS